MDTQWTKDKNVTEHSTMWQNMQQKKLKRIGEGGGMGFWVKLVKLEQKRSWEICMSHFKWYTVTLLIHYITKFRENITLQKKVCVTYCITRVTTKHLKGKGSTTIYLPILVHKFIFCSMLSNQLFDQKKRTSYKITH